MLTLGSVESSWGTQVADLPPSLGDYEGFGNFTGGGNSTVKRAVRFAAANMLNEIDMKTGDAYWANAEG